MDMEKKRGTKVLLVIIDGVADYQIPQFDGNYYTLMIGLTALEKAQLPNMDKISKSGLTGIHDPVQTNLA
jgi:2,3-bisphosphoglycerate-independent phosphoglycerate mutase